MSFSFGAPKPDAPPAFSFGSPAGDTKTAAPKFGIATTQPSFGGFGAKPTTPAPTFNLGVPAVSMPSTGLTFGAPPTVAPATQGLSFGAASLAAPAAPTFSLTSATTAPAFNLTTAASALGAPMAAPPTLSFSTPTTKITGFNIGSPATSVGGFNLTGTTLGAPPAATTTLGSTAAAAAPLNFSFTVASTAPTSTPTTFTLGGLQATAPSAATTGTPVLSFGAASLAKTTGALGFGTITSTPASTGGFALSLTSATSTTASAAPMLPPTGTLTFAQLEDAINKWTIDLEEQGKLFANQAKQLNAWDRLLISNGEKILALSNGIDRVKQQQQQLDQELDFVLAQQKELEDLIVPMERELLETPTSDTDRCQTYQIAENIDTQIKQMSEDLKEIIEQLNESNKAQEMSNPITQIGKILNAHMNSLQWIDRNTTKINAHIDQITKMHDLNRKNHEKNLQKTYET